MDGSDTAAMLLIRTDYCRSEWLLKASFPDLDLPSGAESGLQRRPTAARFFAHTGIPTKISHPSPRDAVRFECPVRPWRTEMCIGRWIADLGK